MIINMFFKQNINMILLYIFESTEPEPTKAPTPAGRRRAQVQHRIQTNVAGHAVLAALHSR